MTVKKRFADIVIVLAISCFLVMIDSLVKSWAYNVLSHTMSKSFIPGVLSFYYAENTGMAWSLLSNHRWIFISASILAVIAIIIYLFSGKAKDVILKISLLLLLSGGVGNLIDRIFRTGSIFGNQKGFVVDMFNFEFIDFPIFNVADIYVCIGAGLLILYMIITEIKELKNRGTVNESKD